MSNEKARQEIAEFQMLCSDLVFNRCSVAAFRLALLDVTSRCSPELLRFIASKLF